MMVSGTKFTSAIGGGTRVDPSEIFRTKRGREDLKLMSRLAISLGLRSPSEKSGDGDKGG